MTPVKIVLVGLIAAGLFSCKKKKDPVDNTPVPLTTELQSGMPSNPANINGYLYSSKENNGGYNNYYLYTYFAVFNDPATNLPALWDHNNNNRIFNFSQTSPGNVSVGNLDFSGTAVPKNSNGISLVYLNVTSVPDDGSVTWHSEGNKSFKPLNQKLDRDYPFVDPSIANTLTVSLSNGCVIDLANTVQNYDSALVTISSGSKIIRKSAVKGTAAIRFSGPEFQGLSAGWTANVLCQGFNYSTRTIEDKIYLFELGYKYRTSVVVNP